MKRRQRLFSDAWLALYGQWEGGREEATERERVEERREFVTPVGRSLLSRGFWKAQVTLPAMTDASAA